MVIIIVLFTVFKRVSPFERTRFRTQNAPVGAPSLRPSVYGRRVAAVQLVRGFCGYSVTVIAAITDSQFIRRVRDTRSRRRITPRHTPTDVQYTFVRTVFTYIHPYVSVRTPVSYFNVGVRYRETLTYPLVSTFKSCGSTRVEIFSTENHHAPRVRLGRGTHLIYSAHDRGIVDFDHRIVMVIDELGELFESHDIHLDFMSNIHWFLKNINSLVTK